MITKPIWRHAAPSAAKLLIEPATRSEQRIETIDIIRIIFAILLPPVGVFLQVGLGLQFWINILLTLLGYIPGIVHAVWIIARR